MRRTAKTPGVKGFGNALNDTIPAANCQRQISRTRQFGRISLFEQSRSACVMVGGGLKPTATVMAALCEARPAVPGAQKVMRPVNLVFVRAGGVRASVSSNLI